ncbi:endocuticle structural glycoprotein ABD-5-like [Wyeomyia smithii]|uniref:endocuticle structural glycoprotein ABD-5-like n=1 Tax=Wyeomyia smithii TaxID=174621 RepID=UPI0024680C81|nr:endocuticle structural glycoprotein ABD-5-like [Wyeomyia smithii]
MLLVQKETVGLREAKFEVTMKFALVFVIGLAMVVAAPLEDKDAHIIQYENDNQGVEGYNFKYDTSNGIQRIEQAQLKNFGGDINALVVRGSYSYLGADGQTYTVNYIADENGFQPEATHIPRL